MFGKDGGESMNVHLVCCSYIHGLILQNHIVMALKDDTFS